MVEQGHGHIVNTASLAGLTPAPLMLPYTTTKHAVVGLSLALRAEAAAHGVRVSQATMSRVIARHFGWTRKKSPGGRASATRSSGLPGARERGGSIPDGSSGSMRPAATSP